MTRNSEYGHKGLFGMLTPQANTTVEPEFWSLLPPGWSMLNARLTSDLDTIEKRLVDYTKNFEATAAQFANAPVEAIAIACTGTSYLTGSKAESQIIETMETRYQVPCITAASATTKALQCMGAEKLALLTPYPESLNQVCTPYWEAQGFEVVAKAGPALETDAFHPIYAMSEAGVYSAYQRLSDSKADAVLMLGTGMATLSPLLRGRADELLPAVSCNVALAWATVNCICSTDNNKQSLETWLAGDHWAERLALISGSNLPNA